MVYLAAGFVPLQLNKSEVIAMETIVYGLWGLAWWQKILFVLVATHITIASVTIYLHRAQAHLALSLHPAIAHFFRFWLWLTTGMQTKEWVAVHRKHHSTVETEADPHSPQVFGIWKVLFEGSELYTQARADKEMVERWGKGAPDDWIERHIYSMRWLGIFSLLIVDIILFGISGISAWGVQMLWIPFFAAGVINGGAHYFGYRNYETDDSSTNLVPWGILIGGEELHNNHHRFPVSARFSVKKGEFDVGWLYIRLLEICKLARVSAEKLAPHWNEHDPRWMLNRYRQQVLLPVAKETFSKEMYRRFKRLAMYQSWSASHREELSVLLRQNDTLARIWYMRERLAASLQEKGDSIIAWRKTAQESSIRLLQEFAKRFQSLPHNAQ